MDYEEYIVFNNFILIIYHIVFLIQVLKYFSLNYIQRDIERNQSKIEKTFESVRRRRYCIKR